MFLFGQDNGLADFPRPVHHRIPNFQGSSKAGERLAELPEFTEAKVVKACGPRGGAVGGGGQSGPPGPKGHVGLHLFLEDAFLFLFEGGENRKPKRKTDPLVWGGGVFEGAEKRKRTNRFKKKKETRTSTLGGGTEI